MIKRIIILALSVITIAFGQKEFGKIITASRKRLNLENYDPANQQTSWGYYIGDLESRIIGGLIPAYFYNYMFLHRDTSLKKINGHLFSLNTKVLAMHQFYGVKEVKVLKKHICKYGEWFDIILIEMTRENWVSKQESFYHYQAIFEE